MYDALNKSISDLSGQSIGQSVKELLPKDVPEDQKDVIALKIESMIDKQTSEIKVATANLKSEVDSKIEELANTANDLKQIPVLGGIGLFIRGMQRPIWVLALLFIDLKVFSNSSGWTLEKGSQAESIFWLLNLLVLGFLFGERAIKNIMPVINKRLGI